MVWLTKLGSSAERCALDPTRLPANSRRRHEIIVWYRKAEAPEEIVGWRGLGHAVVVPIEQEAGGIGGRAEQASGVVRRHQGRGRNELHRAITVRPHESSRHRWRERKSALQPDALPWFCGPEPNRVGWSCSHVVRCG